MFSAGNGLSRSAGILVWGEYHMRIEFSWEFKAEDLEAIAAHLGKAKVDDDDMRSFMRTAVSDAVEDAMLEYEAAINDPDTRVTP
jgi:hypothetical protein